LSDGDEEELLYEEVVLILVPQDARATGRLQPVPADVLAAAANVTAYRLRQYRKGVPRAGLSTNS